jgi:probable HAF family extracellular repeat protein
VGSAGTLLDAKLGPLADNGGPTPTLALLPGSLAIAAGDPAGAPDTDQRGPGYARTIGGTMDIGAYEAQDTRVYPVTTTNDGGAGSLRQAILDADASPGYHVLTFDLPGSGVPTIAPNSPLPALTVPVFVNGTSQPGFADAPLIVLNGANAGAGADGLTLAGGLSSVRGLVVNGFGGAGIALFGDGGDLLAGDYLGTDATGSAAVGNGTGVLIVASSGNRIGLGQTFPTTSNLISGNQQDGIGIYGGSGNLIRGNRIGTDASGTRVLGNAYGIELFSGSVFTTVGGTAPGVGNLISGNRQDGVGIYSDVNLLEGNFIGTDASGTVPLGNQGNGIAIRAFEYGYANTIGGSDASAGNVIADNGQDGVLIDTGTGNALRENAISGNGGLGIELRNGGNQQQAAPVFTSAAAGLESVVSGTLTGLPDTSFAVDLFANPDAGAAQGATLLGSQTVTTDDRGQASFTVLTSSTAAGQGVTATATDPAGNTSAFAAPVTVTAGADLTTLDVPGANQTFANAANDAGETVGTYTDATGNHGFLFSGGTYTSLDFPGGSQTEAEGINDGGQIVGYENYRAGTYGFLLSAGTYTLLDFPGAYLLHAAGINDAGQIVGFYNDSLSQTHGFLKNGDTYTPLDVPAASQTYAAGINDAGQIVGYYTDRTNTHGFLFSGGTYTRFDVPGASQTYAEGINAAGQIVGFYNDGTGTHGFLAAALPADPASAAAALRPPANDLLLGVGLGTGLMATDPTLAARVSAPEPTASAVGAGPAVLDPEPVAARPSPAAAAPTSTPLSRAALGDAPDLGMAGLSDPVPDDLWP